MSDEARGVVDYVKAIASGVRLTQFLSVGALGYVVDNLVLAGLIELLAVPVVFAKPVSAEAAIIVMFAVNDRWTFSDWGDDGSTSLVRRFAKSNVVRWGGAAVAWVVLVALTDLYGVHYFVGNTIGIGAGVVVNYTAESLYTWRVHE